ncbi:MAG: imelysin family protein [Agarilytica sp.]
MFLSRYLATPLLTLVIAGLTSCDSKTAVAPSADAAGASNPTLATVEEAKRLRLPQSQELFEAGQQALQKGGEDLRILELKVKAFLDKPSNVTLKQAQETWFQAALAYRHFDYFRHIALVDPQRFPTLNRADYQIAAYPIRPGFLDAYGPYKFSGLVYDVGFPFNQNSLENQHGLTDVSEVVLGLYAIEFLLFNVEVKRDPRDFLPVATLNAEHKEKGYQSIAEIPKNRRRKLLKLQAELLVKDFEALQAKWLNETESDIYAQWQSLDPEAAFRTLARTTESTLVQILTEIGELNQDEPRFMHVSPQVFASSFAVKQVYVCRAIHSAAKAIEIQEEQVDTAARTHYTRALELCGVESLGEGTEEKDHWREMFSAVKGTSDALANRS